MIALSVLVLCGACMRAKSPNTFAGVDMSPPGGIAWDGNSETNVVHLDKPFYGFETATLYRNRFNPKAAGKMVMEQTFVGKDAADRFNATSRALCEGLREQFGIQLRCRPANAIGAPLYGGSTNVTVKLDQELGHRLVLTVWTVDYKNSETRQTRYDRGELLVYELLERAKKRQAPKQKEWTKADANVHALEMLAVLAQAGHNWHDEYDEKIYRRMHDFCNVVNGMATDDDELYLAAYATCEEYPLTSMIYPFESGQAALKKIAAARQPDGLWKDWTRTGLAVQAMWTIAPSGKSEKMGDYGAVLDAVAEAVIRELRAENVSDEAAAVGGMILLLTDNANCMEVKKSAQILHGWHFDKSRSDYANYCATVFNHWRAHAKTADEAAKAQWHSWYGEIKRTSQRMHVTDANVLHCLWLSQSVLSERRKLRWSSGKRILPSGAQIIKSPVVDVDVEI